MLLYLMRHGETDWNRIYRLQGQSDIPLNENGRSLAQRTGEAMKDVRLDLCYASPLKRAYETAQLVMASRGILPVADDRLKEINFGSAEGKQGRDENGRPVETVADFYLNPAGYVPPEGGETILELCQRTWNFLDELTARKDLSDRSILIGTHGAALQSMMLWVRYAALRDEGQPIPCERFWEGGLKRNCSVTIIRAGDGKTEIIEEGKVYAPDPNARPLTMKW